MRLLPEAMREPISLGYLLARASDTLADTETLDASLRAKMLGGFQDVLHGGDRKAWLRRVAEEVTPKQKHEGEKKLMESMEGVFSWLDSLQVASGSENIQRGGSNQSEQKGRSARQHDAILTVMEHILRGQRLDIERFELRDDFCFKKDNELEEYCYLVAGCVGEFWTEVGLISLEDFSKESAAQMNLWGANYGKGLQLINILRDLPNDFKDGRCYLPGVDMTDHDVVIREAARWRLRARSYLEDGNSYAAALKHRRTRMATVLPGIIGARTLDLLDQADWEQLQEGAKISRSQVYLAVWEAFWF